MVPEGWAREPLVNVAEIRTGVAKGKKDLKDPISVPYLRVANVQDGRIDLTEIKTIEIEREKLAQYALKDGDVLMTEGGDFDKLGRGDVWRAQVSPCINQNHVFAVRVDRTRLLPYYLSSLSGSHYGKSYFLSCAKKSTNLASINSTQLKEFPILIPPIIEQSKIQLVLSTWDQAIETTEKLIENSKAQKKALMQQIITGKKRLAGFSDKWPRVRLGEVFERITTKNHVGNENVLTISGRHGLINQRIFFKKRVASKNLENYTLLRRGDFAYNKSYSTGYPYGAIKPLEKYDAGVVSGLYLCFRLKDVTTHCHDFYRHYFEGGFFDQEIYAIAQEGARNHGLLNVGSKDFFVARLACPSLKDQIAIASVINAAEAELRNFEDQLATLRREKSALMQQLLTGKRRVKVAA